jgi:hypothetical protein
MTPTMAYAASIAAISGRMPKMTVLSRRPQNRRAGTTPSAIKFHWGE